MHSLIIGMTESGKTTLAKQFAEQLMQQNKTVLVLDILGSNWPCDFQTTDILEFMDIVKNMTGAYIFVDESGEVGQLYKEFFWLATRSRHQGHSVFFITQRAKQLTPLVRSQCTNLFLFCTSYMDCKSLYEDFNFKEILDGSNLQQGTFLSCRRFKECKKIKLF